MFCAECMVNILQNISQNRENKAITRRDYAHAVYAAFYCYYGGDPKQFSNDGLADGRNYYYFPHPVLFCIQGQNNGKAKILWIMHPTWYKYPNSLNLPCIRTYASDKTHINEFSIIKVALQTEVSPEMIHPNFTIKSGEIKMLLEVAFFTQRTEEASKHFGFWIYKPKPSCNRSFFNKTIVFSPNTGRFSASIPN